MGLFDSRNLNREVFPCFFCYLPVDQKYHYSIKLMKEDDENLNIFDDKMETLPEGMRFMPYENSVLPKKILRLDTMDKREENLARIGVLELKHHEECLDFGAIFKKYPEYIIAAMNLRADAKELEKRKTKQEKRSHNKFKFSAMCSSVDDRPRRQASALVSFRRLAGRREQSENHQPVKAAAV